MKRGTNSQVLSHVSLFYWTVLALMAGISSLLLSSGFTLGIIFGGLLVIVNFNVLRLSIQAAFSSLNQDASGSRKKAVVIGTFYIRLAIMGVIIYCLLASGRVDPVGMAVGLSTVVIAIFVYGLLSALKRSLREAL